MSKHKYDKSLMEVWEWKEKVYQETKDLTNEKYLERLEKISNRVFSKYNIRLEVAKIK